MPRSIKEVGKVKTRLMTNSQVIGLEIIVSQDPRRLATVKDRRYSDKDVDETCALMGHDCSITYIRLRWTPFRLTLSSDCNRVFDGFITSNAIFDWTLCSHRCCEGEIAFLLALTACVNSLPGPFRAAYGSGFWRQQHAYYIHTPYSTFIQSCQPGQHPREACRLLMRF